MEPMEQEFEEANREDERMVWEALDECQRAGAPADALKLLAWHAGAVSWTPKTYMEKH